MIKTLLKLLNAKFMINYNSLKRF